MTRAPFAAGQAGASCRLHLLPPAVKASLKESLDALTAAQKALMKEVFKEVAG